MANVYAVQSGNWSDTATWNTGALPTAADVAYANNFTVTIDISPTVLSIRTTSATGVSAGGRFEPNDGITLTGSVIAGTTACFFSSLISGESCTINGNCTGGSSAGAHGVRNNSSGAITINGSVTGGSSASSNAVGALNNSSGTITINGSVAGGPVSSSNAFGASNNSSGTTTITGSVTGGASASATGALNNSIGVLSIIGSVASGSNTNNASYGCLNQGDGVVNITGDVTGSFAIGGSNNNGAGAVNASGGTINITGNVRSGRTTPRCFGAFNSGNGTINITGEAIADLSLGVSNSSSGTLVHFGVVRPSSESTALFGASTASTFLTGPFLVSTNGIHAVSCQNWKWVDTTPAPTYYEIRSANLAVIRPLYTADSVGGNPATTNVRSGTVYGPNNELTGACAIPSASAVAAGVPVDNTTGTAIITGTALRDELASELARIANCATTNEVADIILGAV